MRGLKRDLKELGLLEECFGEVRCRASLSDTVIHKVDRISGIHRIQLAQILMHL